MQVMVIAPGDEMDRAWVELGESSSAVQWDATPAGPRHLGSEIGPETQIRTAVLRGFRPPGWRVVLRFLMRDTLLPHGYVMPGWVEGAPTEFVPVCIRCYGHRVLLSADLRADDYPQRGREAGRAVRRCLPGPSCCPARSAWPCWASRALTCWASARR